MIAGAVSGAVSGGTSYVATGMIATGTGHQFNWSLKDAAFSVLIGAGTGAAFAGAGYGIGKFAPKIIGSEGERIGPGDDPSSFWDRGTSDSSRESLRYHLDNHGLCRSGTQYTNDGLEARDALWNAPGVRQGTVPIGGITRFGTAIRYMTGGTGWKIWPAGIYDYDYSGGPVTFWG